METLRDLAKEVSKINWSDVQTDDPGEGAYLQMIMTEVMKLPKAKAVQLLLDVQEAKILAKAYPEKDSPFHDMLEFKSKMYDEPLSDIQMTNVAALEIDTLEQTIADQDKAIRELRRWKREMIESTPDYQAIGKEMGLSLGQNVSAKILPYIKTVNLHVRALIDLAPHHIAPYNLGETGAVMSLIKSLQRIVPVEEK